MIDRGACHMILTSRSGVTTGYQKRKLQQWRKLGANVKISNKDVSFMDQCEALLTETAQMAPVGGIFHLAAVRKRMKICILLFWLCYPQQSIANWWLNQLSSPILHCHFSRCLLIALFKTRLLKPSKKLARSKFKAQITSTW